MSYALGCKKAFMLCMNSVIFNVNHITYSKTKAFQSIFSEFQDFLSDNKTQLFKVLYFSH